MFVGLLGILAMLGVIAVVGSICWIAVITMVQKSTWLQDKFFPEYNTAGPRVLTEKQQRRVQAAEASYVRASDKSDRVMAQERAARSAKVLAE